MIILTHPLPETGKFFMACSGGIDSMAAMHWLSKGGRAPYGIIHVHHNTGAYADRALEFVAENYSKYSQKLFVRRIEDPLPRRGSKESWWREQRYNLIRQVVESVDISYPVILAHNLDDCVEQYVINSLIRMRRREIINYYGPAHTIRPFRTWKRSEITKYASDIGLRWIEDPSNKDLKFQRNRIRHQLLPQILEMNPGLYKFVRTLITQDTEEDDNKV